MTAPHRLRLIHVRPYKPDVVASAVPKAPDPESPPLIDRIDWYLIGIYAAVIVLAWKMTGTLRREQRRSELIRIATGRRHRCS